MEGYMWIDEIKLVISKGFLPDDEYGGFLHVITLLDMFEILIIQRKKTIKKAEKNAVR